MIRCKPLLGTFVEISIDDGKQKDIENAFWAIQSIQELMGFHNPQSELSQINYRCCYHDLYFTRFWLCPRYGHR